MKQQILDLTLYLTPPRRSNSVICRRNTGWTIVCRCRWVLQGSSMALKTGTIVNATIASGQYFSLSQNILRSACAFGSVPVQVVGVPFPVLNSAVNVPTSNSWVNILSHIPSILFLDRSNLFSVALSGLYRWVHTRVECHYNDQKVSNVQT